MHMHMRWFIGFGTVEPDAITFDAQHRRHWIRLRPRQQVCKKATKRGQTVDWHSSCAHGSSARAGLCWCCPRPERWSTELAPLAGPICTRAAIHLTGKVVSFLSRTAMASLSRSLRLRAAKSDSVQPRREISSERMRLAFCSAVSRWSSPEWFSPSFPRASQVPSVSPHY